MRTNLIRTAKAVWNGTGLEGSGKLTTRSGAIRDMTYTHRARFIDEDGRSGTNPEELIAAAHAGCFNMALSFQLNGAGFTANALNTEVRVHMDKEGVDYFISLIEIRLEADVPGIERAQLLELAENAKKGCPISKALSSVKIEMEVK